LPSVGGRIELQIADPERDIVIRLREHSIEDVGRSRARWSTRLQRPPGERGAGQRRPGERPAASGRERTMSSSASGNT
jgi:hypothetical protein